MADTTTTTTNTNTNKAASSSCSGKGPAAAQNRPTKVLKREPILARLQEGHCVVSVPLTAAPRRAAGWSR